LSKKIEKDKMIIVTENPKSDFYAVIFGGLNKPAQFMYEKGNPYLTKRKRNVVYADQDKSLNDIENELKQINPNAIINSVSGFSGGATQVLRAMDSKKYDFIGLIDPYITVERSRLPKEAIMISNSNNWSDKFQKVNPILKSMEDKNVSIKIETKHDDMPNEFFSRYGNLV